jgi:hypothetical protein
MKDMGSRYECGRFDMGTCHRASNSFKIGIKTGFKIGFKSGCYCYQKGYRPIAVALECSGECTRVQ